jgi:hypothetical protein
MPNPKTTPHAYKVYYTLQAIPKYHSQALLLQPTLCFIPRNLCSAIAPLYIPTDPLSPCRQHTIDLDPENIFR